MEILFSFWYIFLVNTFIKICISVLIYTAQIDAILCKLYPFYIFNNNLTDLILLVIIRHVKFHQAAV